MKKAGFWTKDWFVGLIVVVAVVAFSLMRDVIPSLEITAYDWGVTATSRQPSDKIAVIAIDDQSLNNIGRWPWPRDVHAAMIDKLASAKPRVIGSTVMFSEAQEDPGLLYVTKLIESYNKGVPQSGTKTGSVAIVPQTVNPLLSELGTTLAEAEQALNTDRRLAQSIKDAKNVVTAFTVEHGLNAPIGRLDQALPDWMSKSAVVGAAPTGMFAQDRPTVPINLIGEAAASVGNVGSVVDIDGGSRREITTIDTFGTQYPSFSMAVAAKSLNLTPKDIKVTTGESVSLGNLKIDTGPEGLMYPYFYKSVGDREAMPADSFFDVLSGKIPVTKYQDKVVLIGVTAPGFGVAQNTPAGVLTPVSRLSHAVSSILQQHFIRVPGWTKWASLLAVLLVAAYIIVLLPRLRAGPAALVTGVIFLVLIGTHFALMMGPGIWIKLMLPIVILLVGHALLTTKRFLVTERGKEQSDAAGAESNRMLGLAFQQQGQLDMAFDKFRKCPVDEQVMENIYSLALDFERRRQFNKAESAFAYIHQHNPKFKDVGERMNRAKQLSETIVLGGSAAARSNSATMVLSGSGEKPTLGRYTIEKELGKGAMGVVYLGKDPKIGREVAIKTMALSSEFEGDELQEAKDRFFREAESAGKLDHPNIVRIFDAGDEHDLAYIAMEFLKGKDLVSNTKLPNLLPFDEVCDIFIKVAQALHHAHEQGVYHRDIKPANIMYDADAKVPKVADFGIARVTDSSKTKTGMVLGTPSYMSPEQLAGKKIDGRSDLFSLAVSFYQMTSGRLPFTGESMTQLMFAIANEPCPNIMEFNPALPAWMSEFLEQALAKDREQRFQTGNEFANAIKVYRSLPQ